MSKNPPKEQPWHGYVVLRRNQSPGLGWNWYESQYGTDKAVIRADCEESVERSMANALLPIPRKNYKIIYMGRIADTDDSYPEEYKVMAAVNAEFMEERKLWPTLCSHLLPPEERFNE